jgi:hypothetical protein
LLFRWDVKSVLEPRRGLTNTKYPVKEQKMKRFLIHSALALTMALGVASPAALAKNRKKFSPEHYAAVKQCRADYAAAVKAANAMRGKEKRDALAAARSSEKQCIANAPK